MALDFTKHPCFDDQARRHHARIHLPVAPNCNIQCNFCDRRFNCVNESRPGVASTVLSPGQALHYLEKAVERDPRIAVVGIAGPGDPFANAEATMETLRLVRERYPEMLLCVATNGLNAIPYVDELAALEVSHVTVTINAVDPEVGAKIYSWIRDDKRPFRGVTGAKILLDRQLAAVYLLKDRGVTVKVNSILIPGINDDHIGDIAAAVKKAGADIFNCIPLYPVEGTPFAELEQPSSVSLASARAEAGQHLQLMHHCTRCRADACGLLGEKESAEVFDSLKEAAAMPISPQDDRPYVAVASMEDVLVNRHLGEADRLSIYGAAEGGYDLITHRNTPDPGSGSERWKQLAEVLHDCRAVLVSSAGRAPSDALKQAGVQVVMMEGLIEEGLRAVYAGEEVRAPLRRAHRCGAGASCAGDGTGCD